MVLDELIIRESSISTERLSDLFLFVAGCDNIESSHDTYTELEVLANENRHVFPGHRPEDAAMRTLLLKFPKMVKMTLRFTFSERRSAFTAGGSTGLVCLVTQSHAQPDLGSVSTVSQFSELFDEPRESDGS
jgi:hypothetical protein